jgi:peptidoglycan-N-acetylglucosamine deacetylase
MRLYRPGFVAGFLYPEALFRIRTSKNQLLLTFDDGPDPDSTPQILNVLDEFSIKAIFFCNGKAAEKYNELTDRIKLKGHMVGNHGCNHLNGWITSTDRYVTDVENAAIHTSASLFRPPFGRLRLKQYLRLRRKYKMVFWDVMPYDFDKSLSPEKSMEILLKKLRPGSIIVLHEIPGQAQLAYIRQFCDTAISMGYTFMLPDTVMQK